MAKKDDHRRFGARVKELRKLKGLTQEELAEAIERSVDTVSSIERGKMQTRLDTTALIAAALGVEQAELFESADDLVPRSATRQKKVRLRRLIEEVKGLDVKQIDAVIEIARIVASVRR